MEVLEPRAAMLSNYEVLSLLREKVDEQKRYLAVDLTVQFPENLATVQFEVTGYLENSSCSTQTPEQIHAFLTRLNQWKLTKAEKLQILNLRTKSLVELHLEPQKLPFAHTVLSAPPHPFHSNQIIEECEERFTQEKLEQLVEIVQTTLPRDDDQDMAGQNGEFNDEIADGEGEEDAVAAEDEPMDE